MARYVSLGKDANFFRDSVLDISIAPGEIVELNAMQLNSRSIRRALQGGHLIFVEKTKTEKAPELTVDELIESFVGFSKKKDPKKRIAKSFTIDQLKAIAPSFDVEVEDTDTVDTLIDALLEANSSK